ncbi:MAG: site-specific integrase [Ktedonobacteraceae bacterium]
MARQRKKSVRGGGTVFLRKDGRWEAKFKVEATGKYKSLYGETESEAWRKLDGAKYQQKQGTLATGRDQTVKQFLEYWLEDVEKPATRRLNTYITTRDVVKVHLIPGLGHLRLQSLTGSDLQSFYAKKLRGGTSASRIVGLNRVLYKALKHAQTMKIVGVNVAHGLSLPHAEKYKPVFLEAEQADLLLKKARERNMDLMIALAVVAAMRIGEVLGLRWSDIDLVNGELKVLRTLSYKAGYGFFENEPKSASSVRLIALPRFMIDLLVTHYNRQLEQKTALGTDWVEHDLVFTNAKGYFYGPDTLRTRFYRLLKAVGLPRMHFHDLRHSAATILLSMGVPPNMVQELLGHSDISTTLGIYGHVLPSTRRETLNRLDKLYGDNTRDV